MAGDSFHLTGGEQLTRLAAELKAAGRVDLRKELYAGLNRATKPIRAHIKVAALTHLPAEGGLNRRVAAASLSTRTKAGANPGVKIVARESKGQRGGPVDLRALDAGIVRHPTFGHKPTRTQAVTPGFMTETIERDDGVVRTELLAAIDAVARKLRG